MSSRTGKWMIVLGVVMLFMGLLMLPAALGGHPDTSIIALGACGVSLGSMIAASGIYVNARALQPHAVSVGVSAESKNLTRRVRGGCDICHGDLPVIHCKVHQIHLCPDCVAKHYDFRSCTYIPSTRATLPKKAKALARVQGT
jgi:uncharacterized membrane protein